MQNNPTSELFQNNTLKKNSVRILQGIGLFQIIFAPIPCRMSVLRKGLKFHLLVYSLFVWFFLLEIPTKKTKMPGFWAPCGLLPEFPMKTRIFAIKACFSRSQVWNPGIFPGISHSPRYSKWHRNFSGQCDF